MWCSWVLCFSVHSSLAEAHLPCNVLIIALDLRRSFGDLCSYVFGLTVSLALLTSNPTAVIHSWCSPTVRDGMKVLCVKNGKHIWYKWKDREQISYLFSQLRPLTNSLHRLVTVCTSVLMSILTTAGHNQSFQDQWKSIHPPLVFLIKKNKEHG